MSPGWRGIVNVLRETPGFLLLQKVVRRLPGKAADVGTLCFLRFDGIPNVPQQLVRGSCVVRPATVDDIDGLVRLQDKRQLFLDRFSAGDLCVVAMLDGRIVGYEWFSDKPVHHEEAWGLRITVPGGFVYAYDAYIDRACRNTGVWLRFKAFLGEWMRLRDKRGVLTFVEYGNSPSLRTHLRFGFAPSKRVLALKILGITLFKTLATDAFYPFI
jgi:GNAT superfamily N-acetyltransferase